MAGSRSPYRFYNAQEKHRALLQLAARPEDMEKFMRDTWQNIHTLSDPKFIKAFRNQARKKGSPKGFCLFGNPRG